MHPDRAFALLLGLVVYVTLGLGLSGKEISGPDVSHWTIEEVLRFTAPEARQGVTVDADHLYVLGNREIGKYEKRTLAKVGTWKDQADGPVIHFNAGLVRQGELVVAHSNYPQIPMTGSVESFDAETLQPLRRHSFGHYFGSLTWVDRREGSWFACFAHYGNRAAEPNRDPTWTNLVRFDDEWRRTGGWVFPRALFEHIGGDYTLSGGAFGPGGLLYVTGHDNQQMHVLKFPALGSVMEWLGWVDVPFAGQAFAWDPQDPMVLYGIIKGTREVVVCRLVESK
ncbi:MAG: hypothetical protein J6386_10780 [Candidatus Synoicihabitans palmerolidicus]|nr:hypothetical protein [Candidatus Synoicihabitans palmerolidicus]